MNRSLKTLTQETLLYALSAGMMRICGYVVFLVQTRLLTPNDYGILTDFYGNYIAVAVFDPLVAHFQHRWASGWSNR